MNIKEIINKNIDLSEETKNEKIKLMNRIGELFNYKNGTINLEEIANNYEKTKNILITSIETKFSKSSLSFGSEITFTLFPIIELTCSKLQLFGPIALEIKFFGTTKIIAPLYSKQ
jgi:hypothetical protein